MTADRSIASLETVLCDRCGATVTLPAAIGAASLAALWLRHHRCRRLRRSMTTTRRSHRMNRTIRFLLALGVAAFLLVGCSEASSDLDGGTVAANVSNPYKVRYTRNADTFSNIAEVCPDEHHTIIVTSSDYAGYIFLPYCILDEAPQPNEPALSSRGGVAGDGGSSDDGSEIPQ